MRALAIYVNLVWVSVGTPLGATTVDADAGGPYSIRQGDDLLLDASTSPGTSGGAIGSFEWDLDDDGQFDDAFGSQILMSWLQLESLGFGLGINSISMRLEIPSISGPLLYGTNTTVTVSPVPLPASLPILAAGLGILGLLGRRRKPDTTQ